MGLNLVGVFDDATVAANAVRQIKSLGIDDSDIHTHGTTGSSSMGKGSKEHHGFFSRLFGHDDSESLSGDYAEATRRGSTVVTVHLDKEDRAGEVERILEEAGAVNMSDRVQSWRAEGYTGYNAQAADYNPEQIARERETLKVMQEELRVGKREVEAGGIRVHRSVSERPVQEEVSLREERAVIERRPVDRVATSEDLAAFDAGERDIEIREMREEAVVDKQARVVEEISIGKEATERTELIEDTVRRTDVDVEQLDAAQASRLNQQGRDSSARTNRPL